MSFLDRSFELHFNERPFLNHFSYLFITKTTKERSRTQTNFSIRLIDEGWSTWAEIGNSAELTYVSLDGTVQTKTQEPPTARPAAKSGEKKKRFSFGKKNAE